MLPADEAAGSVPWAAQLPYRTLTPIREKVGGFSEVVVFDTTTSTLLVTDLVTSLPDTPPAILTVNDKRSLLYHSRDLPDEANAEPQPLSPSAEPWPSKPERRGPTP